MIRGKKQEPAKFNFPRITLIEILIVLAIICIILAVAIPNLFGWENTTVDAGNGITVDTVYVGFSWSSNDHQRAIAEWQRKHPTRHIISIIKTQEGGRQVVITSEERKNAPEAVK